MVVRNPANKVRWTVSPILVEGLTQNHSWILAILNQSKSEERLIRGRISKVVGLMDEVEIFYNTKVPGTNSFGFITRFNAEYNLYLPVNNIFCGDIRQDNKYLPRVEDDVSADHYLRNYMCKS